MPYDLEKFRQENPAYQNNSLREIATDLYDYHRPSFEQHGYASVDDWADKEGLRESWDRDDQNIMRRKRQGEIDQIRKDNMNNMNFVSRSVARGWNQFQAMSLGAVGLAGSATGLQGVKKWGLEGYKGQMEEAAMYPGTEFEEIGEASTLMKPVKGLQWGTEKLLENLPLLLTMPVAGGVGGFVAGKVAPKALSMMLKGQVRRELSRQVLRKTQQKLTNKAIEGGIKKGLIKEASKEALGTAQKEVMKSFIGPRAGLMVGMGALESGGMFGDVAERGHDDYKAALRSLAFGMGAGAIEIMGGLGPKILNKMFGKQKAGIVSRAIESVTKATKLGKKQPGKMAFLARAFKAAADNAPAEFAQEYAQEILSLMNVASNDPTFDTFAKENLEHAWESGWAGFAVGGLMGGAMGALPQGQAPQTEEGLKKDVAPIAERFETDEPKSIDETIDTKAEQFDEEFGGKGVSADETGKQKISEAIEPITEEEPVETLLERPLPTEMDKADIVETLYREQADAHDIMVANGLDPNDKRLQDEEIYKRFLEDPEYFAELEGEYKKRVEAEKPKLEIEEPKEAKPVEPKPVEKEVGKVEPKEKIDVNKWVDTEIKDIITQTPDVISMEAEKQTKLKTEIDVRAKKAAIPQEFIDQAFKDTKWAKKLTPDEFALTEEIFGMEKGDMTIPKEPKPIAKEVGKVEGEKAKVKEPWDMTPEEFGNEFYIRGETESLPEWKGMGERVKHGKSRATPAMNILGDSWRGSTPRKFSIDGKVLLFRKDQMDMPKGDWGTSDLLVKPEGKASFELERNDIDPYQALIEKAMSENKSVPLSNIQSAGLTLKSSDLANVTTNIKIMGKPQTLSINAANKQLNSEMSKYEKLIACITA